MSLEKLRDLQFFAEKFFIITDKDGNDMSLALNKAQMYLHKRLEEQLKKTGKVRAIVLKGRQQGCSTYIQARFAHKVITRKGTKAYILTHETEATANLFNMTRQYIENLPEGLCPKPDSSSANKLYFKAFKSGYSVGTAATKGTGRSKTIQLFHGCLAEGSLIFDPFNGSAKKIEEFLVGENVLTHTGKIASISYISTQKKECFEVILRGMSAFPLIATPQHRFWTKNGWKKLKDFKSDDVIGYPIKIIKKDKEYLELPVATKRKHGGGRQYICPNKIKINYRLGRLVGLYLAEGHIKLQKKEPHNPSSITFVVHRKELGRTIKWIAPFHKYFSSIKSEDREDCLTSAVTIYGNRFSSLINKLCGRTSGKHLPTNWYEMGEDFCKGLLHGYIAGDGYSDDKCRRVRASSIRSSITFSLRDLSASLGYGWASIEFKPAGLRSERNEKDRYTFSLCGNGASLLASEIGKITPKIVNKKTKSTKLYAANSTEISNGYAWMRLTSISYAGMRQVYDLEIAHDDHSYCAIQGATHNSEVAFWPNAATHAAGVMQAVPRSPNTEIILESTANGMGDYYHDTWQGALSGESEYQAIFLPWYWQSEYIEKIAGFEPTEEEFDLYNQFKSNGLTFENLCWRRLKIREFNAKDIELGLEKFKQEYPMTAAEAFRNPIENAFINSIAVMRARKTEVDTDAGLIIGVDPALGDKDKFTIIRRRGRRAYKLERHINHNTMQIVGVLRKIIDKEKPVRVYIDVIGIGAGIVDRLLELGYSMVEGLNSARNASEISKYSNKRAEMWQEMRDWLNGESPVEIPDSDVLHADLCGLGFRWDSNGRLVIERKEDLKKRGLNSPDTADALALTFAGGFYDISHGEREDIQTKINTKGKFF